MDNAYLALIVLIAYFVLLCTVGYFTGRSDSNDDFFRAGKKSPWFVVAFGMIGVNLSGVTYLSVPGTVSKGAFSYMEMICGNVVGYWFMALVLLPLYYRMNLTSIYTYLQDRFGFHSYKTGAGCFLLSRVVGASLRLFLVAVVLHQIIFATFGLPFEFTAALAIALIWVYTYRGGIKTVVWTDTLQTFFLLLALVYFLCVLPSGLDTDFSGAFTQVKESGLAKMFTDWSDFGKNFIAGIFLAIVMNGFDQDMMQKHLTCKDIKSAQKNVFVFSLILPGVVFCFLILGGFLGLVGQQQGLEVAGDQMFLSVVNTLPGNMPFIIFLLGVVAAAYSSADSALASLTTSYCVDIANIESKDQAEQLRLRRRVHIIFSVILFFVVSMFYRIGNNDVVWTLFKAMGYTYGPLLALFSFGILTKRRVNDKLVPYIALACPVISYGINFVALEKGWNFGVAILLLNGALGFVLLWVVSKTSKNPA